jgi:hypothetical protein
MHEDDYTGSRIDDDDELSLIEDTLSVIDVDLGDDLTIYASEDDNETDIYIRSVADGAGSLQEIAERLYDLADELLELSGEGWEIIDDIANGHGVAVKFDVDESDELEDD